MADESSFDTKEVAVRVLQGISVVLNMLGAIPNIGQTAGGVLTGLGGASNVLAGFLEKGVGTQDAIAIWKSALEDVAAANKRIDDEVVRRTGGPK